MASPEWRAISGAMREVGVYTIGASAGVIVISTFAPDSRDVINVMRISGVGGAVVGGIIHLIGKIGQEPDYF